MELRSLTAKYHPDYHPVSTINEKLELLEKCYDSLLDYPEVSSTDPKLDAVRILQLHLKLQALSLYSKKELMQYHVAYQEELRCMEKINRLSNSTEIIYLLAQLLKISTRNEQWQYILRYAEQALPFAEPTEKLLAKGGDDRTNLKPGVRTNKYYTSTIPDDRLITRSSCTCSNIEYDVFKQVEELKNDILRNALFLGNMRSKFTELMNQVRGRILSCLNLQSTLTATQGELILSPSGSDAEFMATAAAIAHYQQLFTIDDDKVPHVYSIMTAAGEVGSGSSLASGGKHFSTITPTGAQVKPKTPVLGFNPDIIHTVEFPARTETGEQNKCDDSICSFVDKLLIDRPDTVVLLHVVLGAKTGLNSLSFQTVAILCSRYGQRIVVVVDACQLRLQNDVLQYCIAKGYIVLITGSKFFGGSPFCGGIILPGTFVKSIEEALTSSHTAKNVFPIGYASYFTKDEFPDTMVNAKRYCSPKFNVGLWLRWETSLIQMEQYATIPPQILSKLTSNYMIALRQLIESFGGTFKLLDVSYDPTNTIASFHVYCNSLGRYLTHNELKQLHQLLSLDLHSVLSTELSSYRVMIGQPVMLGTDSTRSVIRIALGASMLNSMFRQYDSCSTLIGQDRIVLTKIQTIVDHWELCCAFIDNSVATASNSPEMKPVTSSTTTTNFQKLSANRSDIPQVIQTLQRKKLFSDGTTEYDLEKEAPKLAIVYDIDAVGSTFEALAATFPNHFRHHFAIKSCPLSFFLKMALDNGMGVECASIGEVKHAQRIGFPPHKIVYDSPCKTPAELTYAIHSDIMINVDNFEELDTIISIVIYTMQSKFPETTPSTSGKVPIVGLRINPLIGAGKNELLSVSTPLSKFGIPLTTSNRAKIIEYFRRYSWLTALHCHVGSQGCGLEMLAQGAKTLVDLANEIDHLVGFNQITVLNIGGGLPANYQSELVSPTFSEYCNVLETQCPQLFENSNRLVLTEFGRSISAKTAWTISEVEYAKNKENEVQTAIIHAGSDLFLRSCYLPKLFPRRIEVFKNTGEPSEAPTKLHNIAGPLCFGGDLIGREICLPTIETGDYVVIRDTGSNTISLYSRHCSRQAPVVYGYRKQQDSFEISIVKAKETVEQTLSFWGE